MQSLYAWKNLIGLEVKSMSNTTYQEIGTPICKDYTYTTSKGATSQVWRMVVVEQSSSDSDTTMVAIKKGFLGEKGVFIPKTSILVPLDCKDWLGETLSKMVCRKVASKTQASVSKMSDADLNALATTLMNELNARKGK